MKNRNNDLSFVFLSKCGLFHLLIIMCGKLLLHLITLNTHTLGRSSLDKGLAITGST
jgi:hypothetical protein